MGGLGNQLFQYALALKFSQGANSALVVILDNARKDTNGTLEIETLKLYEGIVIREHWDIFSWWEKRVANLLLRLAARNEMRILVSVLSKILSIRTGKSIIFSLGVGHYV